MRHDHIVVTLDADDKSEIEADLDAGETVEAWVADAVERKLAESNAERGGDDDGDDDDGDRPGYEFVDDCAI